MRMRIGVRVSLFSLIVLLMLAAGGLILSQPTIFGHVWPHLLMVRVPLQKADCLILLGGDGASLLGRGGLADFHYGRRGRRCQ